MKLGCGITGLAVVHNFPKMIKEDWTLSVAPKLANFANVQGSSAKKYDFYPQSSNAKNDRLSFLFILICETWQWYYQFGCGANFGVVQNFPKWTGFCQRSPNTPILPIFGGQVRKSVKLFHQNFNAKTDRLSFLFAMICDTWQ